MVKEFLYLIQGSKQFHITYKTLLSLIVYTKPNNTYVSSLECYQSLILLVLQKEEILKYLPYFEVDQA